MNRAEELAANLAATHARIAAAVAAAGRSDTPTLVVVTKFFPALDVQTLISQGVADIGESRDQEARDKIAQLSDRPSVTVHFIGQVQTNKVRSIASYSDVVQSVDRPKLVAALDRAAHDLGRRLDVLLQVNVEDGPSGGRAGVPVERARELADLVANSGSLRLRGVMTVAPLGAEPGAAFAILRRVHDDIRRDHPDATWMSAGMSGDLEEAVAAGATHLRVGTAILGSRQSHR